MLPKIATPKYDMIVPSTGKSITYRPYVVKEEKMLLIAMESQDEKQIENAVMNIIEECVESPLDINTLTNFDVEFMFVTLRAKSVGEGIELSPKCQHCEETNAVKLEHVLKSCGANARSGQLKQQKQILHFKHYSNKFENIEI